MNQISLYNKSTDSKLSIEAEELTRSRNIKIPKDGSFLLTNKTRLTEELAPKYTVGPTGDFQELEEAVRVLCNMKRYSSTNRDVIVELQNDYIFKPYYQFSIDAGFIRVIAKAPINLEVSNGAAVFSIDRGGVSPRFEQFNMNIKVRNSRLFNVVHQSALYFDNCTFNFDYQDIPERPLKFPFFLHYDSSRLVVTRTVFNMDINKDNNTMLNNGNVVNRWLSVCGENTDTIMSYVKINIRDHSNMNDNSTTSVLPSGLQSRLQFGGNGSIISYSSEHGRFSIIWTHSNGCVTLGNDVTITANSKTGNSNSIIMYVRDCGTITCNEVNLVDCGMDTPIGTAFFIFNGSTININSYRNRNSQFTELTNIQKNTLTRSGIIYN